MHTAAQRRSAGQEHMADDGERVLIREEHSSSSSMVVSTRYYGAEDKAAMGIAWRRAGEQEAEGE